MAHECPECGILCRCGGDVDDLLLNQEGHIALCAHCPLDGVHDEPYERPEEEDEGCEFPGECCMPGPHRRGECHTARMIEDYEHGLQEKGP